MLVKMMEVSLDSWCPWRITTELLCNATEKWSLDCKMTRVMHDEVG